MRSAAGGPRLSTLTRGNIPSKSLEVIPYLREVTPTLLGIMRYDGVLSLYSLLCYCFIDVLCLLYISRVNSISPKDLRRWLDGLRYCAATV